MGFNQERYFILSGLLSIALFIILLFLFFFGFMVSSKVEQFAMTKSEYISISISPSPTPSADQSNPEPKLPVPEEVSEEATPSAEETPSKPEPVADVSDLFAEVKSEKPPKKLREEPKRNEQLSALEKELLAHQETPRFSDKVSKVDLSKPSVKMSQQGGSTGPVVNEYRAKIQGLVHNAFRPPAGTVGKEARIRMTISASGKLLRYKVIRYSDSAPFNTEVDWLKERLESVRFPDHPEGRDIVLEVILAAKE
jgi:protein TonB